MDKVQHLISFLAMLEVLDGRYGIRTHIGAVAVRTRLNRLSYQTSKDFDKFLSLFEIWLEDVIQAGNIYTEYDKMFQLAQSLGEGYIDSLSGMENLRPEFQNFSFFLMNVCEKHDLSELFNSKLLIHLNSKDDNPGNTPENIDKKLGKGPRCFLCNEYGHHQFACSQQTQEENSSKPPPDSTGPKEKKLDWTKFVTKRTNKD